MNIAVLGTGMVGQAIASRLVALGHQVTMGARRPDNPQARAWAERAGERARAGTFAEAAASGALVFNCTHGASSVEALRAAGDDQLAGKIIVDVANVLPPDPTRTESLGEEIQRAFPRARVVKSLNTMNCQLMVNPGRLSGAHTVFMSGDDGAAKQEVRQLLETLGWQEIIDLGGISTARAAESYLSLWLALWKATGTADFNIKVVR